MAITLTEPVDSPAATTVRLQSFTINAELRYAEAVFIQGHLAGGEFVTTSTRRVIFQDNSNIADFTFTQLVNGVQEVRQLRLALEQAATNLGLFDGSVT